jgi:putative acyl-CoA dehydrogenase
VQLLPENTYRADPALRSLLRSWLRPETLEWAEPQLDEVGRAAPAELKAWGDECERQPAFLRLIEPWGERVDEVVHAPAWDRLAGFAARSGCVGLPYDREALRIGGPEVRLVQAALNYLFEPGTATYHCPVAMTDAAARVLIQFGPDDLRDRVVPHLVSRDPGQAWTAGQWMTEQQGGSDVGSNAVEARRQAGGWRLHGRKFFCSNVDGELVLALARPEGGEPGTRGLGLFLVPRLLPGGGRNHLRIDRLKDKLGTRAMPTGEVTLEGAEAELVGELDRGFHQITPMLNITRIHNAIAAAAGMRRGLMLARGYAAQRRAFGKRLDQLPLQRQVLAQMAVEAEAALLLTMRIAALLGRIECGLANHEEEILFRAGTSLVKLYTGRRAVAVASEAIECFGGQGYMEDTGIARLLRDAQVLPIWEGTTNVLSLDLLRILSRPGTAGAVLAEVQRLGARGTDQLAARLGRLATLDREAAERSARSIAFELGRVWTDGLLREAAGRGSREQAVLAAWELQGEPSEAADDGFDLIVDGVAQTVAATS